MDQLRLKRDTYGIFTGPIDTESMQRITSGLTELTDPRALTQSIHLFLHSPGGEVPQGIALYNFFNAFPLPLTLYNCGHVDSAAALAFLGAKQRRASIHATFTIHKTAMSVAYPQPASMFREYLSALETHDETAMGIYRQAALKLTAQQWDDLANYKNVMFSAEQAKKIGFVQEIASFSFRLRV